MNTIISNPDEISAKITLKKILLICGILSSIIYIGTDILGASLWEGYSYSSQTVSELSAVGSPNRQLIGSLFFTFNLLIIAFGFGVLKASDAGHALRVTAYLLLGYGAVCLLAPFFPMHQRGTGTTLTDTMHIVLTCVTVVLIFLIIGFGAAAFGKKFRIYSVITIFLILIFGIVTGLQGPLVAANLPTPLMGIYERIIIYSFMLWVIMLALKIINYNKQF